MSWFHYEKTGPSYSPKVTHVAVRCLGIPRVVVVRTKKNGGIRTRKIEVQYVETQATKKAVRQQLLHTERPAWG